MQLVRLIIAPMYLCRFLYGEVQKKYCLLSPSRPTDKRSDGGGENETEGACRLFGEFLDLVQNRQDRQPELEGAYFKLFVVNKQNDIPLRVCIYFRE